MSIFRFISSFCFFSLAFILGIHQLQAGVPDVGSGKCVANCGSGARTYTPRPGSRSPTPEERKQAWEEQDLQEAADDANDTGTEFYEKGDWANAIKYFRKALEYKPGDEDTLHNLRRAEAKLEEAKRRSRIAEREAQKKKERAKLNYSSHQLKYIADAALKKNDYATAIEYYKKALAKNHPNPRKTREQLNKALKMRAAVEGKKK